MAGVAAAALLLVFVRSERGGTNLCALAEATLRDAAKRPISIGRCEVDPLSPRVRVEHVTIGAPDDVVLAAELIEARLSTRGIFEGRVLVDGVRIVRPQIRLDLSAPNENEEPTRPPRTSCLPDLGALEIGRVDVQGGLLELRLPAGVVRAEGLDVGLRGRRSLIEAGLGAASASFESPNESIALDTLQVRGRIDLERGEALVERLEASAEEGTVFASAVFANVCAPIGRAQATVNLDLERVGQSVLHRFVPDLGGRLKLELSAELGPEGANATVEGALRDGQGFELGPLDADFSAVVTPDTLRLDSLHVPFPSGHVSAHGSLALSPPFMTDVGATLERVVLGELLERLGVPDLTVHIDVSGKAHLQGALGGPGGPSLSGRVDWLTRDFGVYDDTWRKRAKAKYRWVGFPLGRLRSGVTLRGDRVTLHEGVVTVGDSTVNVSGDVFFSVEGGLDLVVDAPRLRLESLGPYGPTPIEGLGTLKGTVRSAYTGLDIQASAKMQGVDVMGLDLGAMSASARIDLKRDTLVVSQMNGLKGRSPYSGEGIMRFTDGAPMKARVDLPDAWLGDVATVARGLVPSLESLRGKVDARLAGELVANGPAARLNVDGTLALADVVLYGQHFDRGWVEVSMLDGERLEFRSLDLERGKGRVQASGEWAFVEGGFEVKAQARDLLAQDIDLLRARSPELTGRLSANASVSGTFDAPRGRATVSLDDLWLGDQPIATAQVEARLGRRLTLDALVQSPEAPAALEMRPPSQRSMRHVLRADVQLEKGLPFKASATFDVPDLGAVMPPGTLEGIQSSIRGTMAAQGTLADLARTSANIRLSDFRLQKGRARFTNSAEGEAEWRDGRLVLHQLPLRGAGMSLDARGAREPDGTLGFTLGGSAELDVLEEFIPSLELARGHVELALQLRGTLAAPAILGEAHLADVRLTPAGGLLSFTNGAGSLVFSPELIVVDALRGRVNGGDVELNGRVTLDRFSPKDVDLTASLIEVPFRLPDFSMRLSGTPTLRGPLASLHLGGESEVTWLRFTQDLELERTLVKALEFTRRPPAPKVFERRGEFLTLDLGVHLGDVRIENNLAQTGLAGDLRLVGTNRRPGVLGTVTLTDGRAFVRNVEYRVTSGVVNFTDPQRIRPAFDVRADASVRDYLVRVAASGTAQQPRLLLSSDPSLPYADIVTLLTLGVTGRDLERTDGSSGFALLLDAAYNAGFLGLNDQVKRLLPENDILRDASFRVTSAYSELTGNVEPIAQFESKVLTDDIRLKGQTSLLGSRGSRAQIEYRIGEGLSVQGQVDSNDPNTPSGFDLGGDVIFRKEWP